MENIKAIILAAGEGTRMKSKLPKVLHTLGGKPMLSCVIEQTRKCGAKDICIVIGRKGRQIKDAVTDSNITFRVQDPPKGTGHAVMQADDFIDEDKDILVLYGDTPLIKAETLVDLLDFHKKGNYAVSVISSVVEDSAGYGHIVRNDDGSFQKIVEHKDATEEEKKIKEINTGIYCFQGRKLKKALGKLTNENAQGEYYLPDTLSIIKNEGGKINAMAAEDMSEFYGVNSRVQLAQAEAILRQRILKEHMENGVTIVDPANTYIQQEVVIGCDTVIYPGVVLEGKTVIGEDCFIGPSSRLTDVKVGDGVKIQYTTAMDCEIGNETTVGPYAYIRPNSKIGQHVKIGDFVEIKNSTLGNNTKVSHLTYVGDSDVGERINFGCGTVTVNYDGKKKYRTVIEDDVFVGCNTNLVAPVTVKKGAYIAAGSTITKEVPEEALAVARARQENIKGWVKKHNN